MINIFFQVQSGIEKCNDRKCGNIAPCSYVENRTFTCEPGYVDIKVSKLSSCYL